jgi:hypothetical protein
MAKFNYFGAIQSREEAEKAIKETTWVLYGLGALTVVVSYFVLHSLIFDGFIWIVLGFLLSIFKNRVVAATLLLFAVFTFCTTILAAAGVVEGGTNIYLAAALVAIAYRVWQAVSFLKKNPPVSAPAVAAQ